MSSLTQSRPRMLLAVVVMTFMLFPVLPTHAASSFSDVSATSPEAPAVEFLKAKGILQGYPDGTFRPRQLVTRAEAVKILVATTLSPEEIQTFTTRSYTDVPGNVWFGPYVEAAFGKLGLIDGPPKTVTFRPGDPIRRAEFLKLLFKSQGIDTNAYGEIIQPMATDVTDSSVWFYPAMRYAVSAAMIHVETDGSLRPGLELTRGELALELYYLSMYQAGKRTQAGLSTEESDLVNILDLLERKELDLAGMAATRALLSARGAHASKPTVAIVQAAVKIAEAFRGLVTAYRAGAEGRLQDVITTSKEAWSLAEKAKSLSPGLEELSGRVQSIARSMADQAREMLKAGASASSQ